MTTDDVDSRGGVLSNAKIGTAWSAEMFGASMGIAISVIKNII